jgi:hypothetical protein
MSNRPRGASLPAVQRSAVPVFLSIADRRDSSRAVRRRRRRRAVLLAVAVLVAIGGALVGARSALAAPTPVVTTPADYTPYFQGDVVLADYFCADSTSCGGTRPSGEPIDTATPGRKLFDVSAGRDGIGNTRHLTYWVVGLDVVDEGERVAPGATLPFDLTCASTPAQSSDPACTATVTPPSGPTVPIAAGAALPTSAPGTYVITVDARDVLGRGATLTRTYVVLEGVAPTATIETPAAGTTLAQGAASALSFACEDEAGGSGLATVDGCTATVTAPGAGAQPIADGDPVPTAALGEHEIVVTARDADGNVGTARRTYAVVPRAPLGGGQAPTDVGPIVDPPVGPPGGDPVLPPVRTCPVRAIELVSIRATGTRSRPTVRLTGWADATLVGAAVTIRRDGVAIGRARVAADGSVRATVPAPRGARVRAVARYRLLAGALRSRALKATRALGTSSVSRRADGTAVIAGRITTAPRSRRLTLVGSPTCGDGVATTRTIHSDARGRFRVVLRPPTAGRGLIYRLRAGSWSATLPLVVTAR